MPTVWKSTVKRDRLNAEEVPSLPSEVLGETFAQTYEEMPFLPGGLFARGQELDEAEGRQVSRGRPVNVRRITAAQAMERVKRNGLEGHLTFDKDTTEEAVDLLSERKRKEIYRQDIASRSPGGLGLGAAKFGLAVGTSLADPASALLNFVPVVSQARYARWLKLGGNALGRAGVRTAVGAAEGAVGAALFEPVLYTAKQHEQADYDMTDSLLNVAFGGITGGGIHMIGGASADAYRALRGIEQPWHVKTPLRDAITAGQAAREATPRIITPELVERGGVTLDKAIDAALGAQAAPVTRAVAPVAHAVDEVGGHTATISENGVKIGEAQAQEGGYDGSYLKMGRIDVNEDARGLGIGQELTLDMARQAEAKGLQLASDVSVSPDQVRVYEALERRGVPVERNPRATVNPETKNLVSDDPRRPVFTVGKLPQVIKPRKAANAAELVGQAGLSTREAALRTASTQLAEGEDVSVAGLYEGADKTPAAPDPDTAPAKSEAADEQIREGDDSLEAAEEAAKLEEQLTAQTAKLMDIDIKPLMEAAENEAQRIDMYAQAAELAQVCLARGG